MSGCAGSLTRVRVVKRKVKIPTKLELQQLQKLYKTDEKIGERLGGVPSYLVAYWRRKKNIPKYSLPKFSEQEVRNLWERYGDDEKAGLDLAISKAAFYNWRRRYGLKDKPAFLKLEQLELNFPGIKTNGPSAALYGKRTVAAKIVGKLSGTPEPRSGETYEVEPDLVIVGNDAAAVIAGFKKLGTELLWNPTRVMISMDFPSSTASRASTQQKVVREFVRRQSVRGFYDYRDGSLYQVALEQGYLLPGQLSVTTESNASVLGVMGGLALKIDNTQASSLWATGRCSISLPPAMRVAVGGRRYRGVYAIDMMLAIIQQIGKEAAKGKVLEWSGSVLGQMTISERLTVASLSASLGASAAVLPYDATTRRYLTGRTGTRYQPVIPDKDAEYESSYQINIDHFRSLVAGPDSFDKIRPAAELEHTVIQQVILGSTAGGRFEELRIAADILKGKQLSPDVRMFIVPDSRSVYLEALKKGLIRVFIEAGAIVMQPAHDTCALVSTLCLADGEKCLVTGDRPFLTRSAGEKSEVYLCSAATAAASALNGRITDPGRYVR